jgi:chemotaxis protein CheD
MGELAIASAGDVLITVGLGSCIGLALLDRGRDVAGLAHVVLPDVPAAGPGGTPGKFAASAVATLLGELLAHGARHARIEAAIVGGAQMFAFGGLEIGARNEAAVREALASERVRVTAALTGGSTGRTMHVHATNGVVVVRTAGQDEQTLLGDTR